MMAKNVRKKNAKNDNSFFKLLIIVLAIAVVSVAAAYFILRKDDVSVSKSISNILGNSKLDKNTMEMPKTVKNLETEHLKSGPLEGTWVSNYDGAMLSIKGGSFSIEMPSVDASSKVEGKIMIVKTIATFVNTNGNEKCREVEGHYSFSINNDELQFTKIKDSCSKRESRMKESWFKL
jgi:hypothetical protein